MTFPNFGGIPGAPQLPWGVPTLGSPFANTSTMGSVNTVPMQGVPGAEGLQRACSFAADHQGCGFWRIHWPEALINGQQLGIVNNNNFMVLQENFYHNVKSVRVQRQVTPTQLQFIKFLRELSNKTNGFKIYYDIDDVIFPEDIPLYNKAREAFVDPAIAKTAVEAMNLCDAITAPTKYMCDYYTEKSGGVPSILLPDYMPKFWIDRFYNKSKIVEGYEKNKRRPRVGYIGSPTHFNVDGTTGIKDDFADILTVIIKTVKSYKWVIMGGLPRELVEYVRSGDIEYVPWVRIWDYPQAYSNLNLNIVIAPLQDNRFNLAKAPIKYIEAGAFGLPCVCQDLEPFKAAPHRFKTADEMMDQIKKLLSDRRVYLNASDEARKISCGWWLEDHISEFTKLYFT